MSVTTQEHSPQVTTSFQLKRGDTVMVCKEGDFQGVCGEVITVDNDGNVLVYFWINAKCWFKREDLIFTMGSTSR